MARNMQIKVGINTTVPNDDSGFKFRDVMWGGQWKPSNCRSKDKVALIVPYRHREDHLRIFLRHMHSFLQLQSIDYTIFVIEQVDEFPFNRAALLNSGFIEAQKQAVYDCFIFHDVDLLPEDLRNLYLCPPIRRARHLTVAIDTFNYTLPYSQLVGGALVMRRIDFQRVNGFSNLFWGWGGEDDEMHTRMLIKSIRVIRYKSSISRYTMLKHPSARRNPNRFLLMTQSFRRYKNDGLTSLKYDLEGVVRKKLYTIVRVKLKFVNTTMTFHNRHYNKGGR
ncbi:beta-1,4-N-acetylgalactosaminyltransferase bre-4-like [Tubulanus polymorphus]|uniref:beta-1,4-N-acetylgalactosaminyltransferase bre-4-like n=1 Tax=Tubulanus polymorphus TaxID=672921 RepID=UPI003DA33898